MAHESFTISDHDTTDRHPRTVLKSATSSFSFGVDAGTTESNTLLITEAMWVTGAQSKWDAQPPTDSYIRIVAIGRAEYENSYIGKWEQEAKNTDTSLRIAYTQYQYLQSSPPYEIEHFIYLLLNPDGSIKGAWEAEDPPWKGQGFEGELTEEDIPHPFIGENRKVVLVNPSAELIAELKSHRKKLKKGILEFINEGYYVIGDEISKARGPVTERIIAKGVEFRPLAKGKPIKV